MTVEPTLNEYLCTEVEVRKLYYAMSRAMRLGEAARVDEGRHADAWKISRRQVLQHDADVQRLEALLREALRSWTLQTPIPDPCASMLLRATGDLPPLCPHCNGKGCMTCNGIGTVEAVPDPRD